MNSCRWKDGVVEEMKSTIERIARVGSVATCLVLVSALVLEGCGGGGGGGAAPSSNQLMRIEAAGISSPLWQNVAGTPVLPPGCISPVFLNSTVVFTFGNAVNPASLPQAGVAIGSINIMTVPAGGVPTPALGTFSVQDDPSLPAGNNRRVLFLPSAPTDPNNPTASGFMTNSQYSITVPSGSSGGQCVTLGGMALANSASTCFLTCNPPPANPTACFTDPVLGAPYVVSTVPAMSDPAPAPIQPNSIANNTISVYFSEPLAPANVDLANIKLIRLPSGAQVPGTLIFYQAGSPQANQGGANGARVDYIASSPLLANTQYEIVITNAVRDFGNNTVAMWAPGTPPTQTRRLFSTVSVPFCPAANIVEDFSTTVNRFSTSGVVEWNGGPGAMLTTTLPTQFVGTGNFGAMTFNAGTHTLDTGMPNSAGFSQGVWDTTTVTVNAGAIVRIIGTGTNNANSSPVGWSQGGLPMTLTRGNLANKYPVHIRCRGAVLINGQLNGSAGTNATASFAYGAAEQGPRIGQFNNGGGSTPNIVAGGVGGVGGGEGGRASQGGATRTAVGEAGYGAPLAGAQNVGPTGANSLYGGGGGGVGNFRNPGAGVPGDLGGLGGAGGSAFQAGTVGGPYGTIATGCQPFQPTSPTPGYSPAQPAGQPTAFAVPISVQGAGSGGGGGGDRFELATPPANDDQGGGGGGGGGGIRISAVQDITVGATGIIAMNGAVGAAGSSFFGGAGGGGSGGQIWLQSFSNVVIATSANMTVNNGAGASTCGDQASGRGGLGLYQFEDADGLISTTFTGGSLVNGNIIATQFPYSSVITGSAMSNFFDLGYGDPDITNISTNFNVGNAPGAVVSITFQGAFEALSGGGADPATLSAPVSAANFNQLDGYRYIRFNVNISYSTAALLQPVPPTLPSVSNITISFNTPCP